MARPRQEHAAVTRDLSMGGIFLYTQQRISEGSKLEIVLILPAELGFGEKQWACCQASVVRVEETEAANLEWGADRPAGRTA